MLAFYLLILDSEDEKVQFTAIYEKYKYLVYHIALGVLHDEYLAEDIVQEVFLYVAKNFSHLPADNSSKMASYLVIAARTRAVNLLKKRGREIPSEFIEDTFSADEPLPEDTTVSLDSAKRMM